MSDYKSPALQRFERLLADQGRFNDFLEKVSVSVKRTTGEFAMNNSYPTTAEIDAALPELPLIDQDFVLVRQDGMITWEGAGRFDQYESDKGFGSATAAIANAQSELSSLMIDGESGSPSAAVTSFQTSIDDEESVNRSALNASEVAEGIHFEVYVLNDLYHWESIGPFAVDDLCSEDGFEREADCVTEARETLSLVSRLGVDAALARIDLLALMMNRLYPSDQQAIVDAVSVLPFDRRWQRSYEMASTADPMPSQYWPDASEIVES